MAQFCVVPKHVLSKLVEWALDNRSEYGSDRSYEEIDIAQKALGNTLDGLEPVHCDVLPPVGSRVFIRHGRDENAHACIVTGYYAWSDLNGDKNLHRVFVRLVYEGTMIAQARMLCDCYPSAEAALQNKAAQKNSLESVFAELERAMSKFPTWPTDPLHALAVLGEEFGELTKDVLQMTYEPNKTSAENVRKEAIQTAAMGLRFVASLDEYLYKACEQHKQDQWQLVRENYANSGGLHPCYD